MNVIRFGKSKMMKLSTMFLVVASAVAISRPARAISPHLTDFDSFPNTDPTQAGDFIDIQWGADVAFSSVPDAGSDPINKPRIWEGFGSHSGRNHLEGGDFGIELGDADLRMKFTSDRYLVEFYAGSDQDSERTAVVWAYDVNGILLLTVPVTIPAAPSFPKATVWKFVSIETPNTQIREIRYKMDFGGTEYIDSLYTLGDPPGAPPPAPFVKITAPLNNANLDFTNAPGTLTGTITGVDLDATVQARLTSFATRSGFSEPTTEYFSLPLIAGQNQYSFSRTLGATNLPYGYYEISVIARNQAGIEGRDTVIFSNLSPELLRLSAGDGQLKYSVASGPGDEPCQIAFFATRAFGVMGGNSVPTPIPLDIAQKWQDVRSPILGRFETLGCPLPPSDFSHPGDMIPAGWAVTGFRRGRVYSRSSGGVHWVPQLFIPTLRALRTPDRARTNGGIDEEFRQIGWPVEDPTRALETDNPTWAFQRFAQDPSADSVQISSTQRSNGTGFSNTLEVRGRAPMVLQVERIGGDIDEMERAQLDTNFTGPNGAPLRALKPTLWQVFPCSMATGESVPTSCEPAALESFPYPSTGSFPAVDGTAICRDNTASVVAHADDAWAPFAYEMKYYKGIIKKYDDDGPSPGSHLANSDFFLYHKWCHPTGITQEERDINDSVRTYCVEDALFGFVTAGLCAEAIANQVEYYLSGKNCKSDWNMHTRPLPPEGADPVSTTLPSIFNPKSVNSWLLLSGGNIRSWFPVQHIDFEVEFEAMPALGGLAAPGAPYFFKRFAPMSGDLVMVHGRHIADCLHDGGANGEIHPADSMAIVRSYIGWGYPASPRQTDAYIWLNGYFAPHQSATFMVDAPPRPSATARMHLARNAPDYAITHGNHVVEQLTEVRGRGWMLTLSLDPVNPGNWYLDTDAFPYWEHQDSDFPEYRDNWRIWWE
jgi:hypothetical protein